MSLSLLFQRLYNWIKYKTLPPSVLFKNRLFIERDSKHKRIFNNFGLVFRNSKWTNYETYNIKTEFRLSFYKYILLFFFIIAVVMFFTSFKFYYISNPILNLLSFLFWTCYDAIDYYFSFMIWMFTISLSLMFKILYSYFFFNNFADNSNIKSFFTNKFFAEFRVLPNKSDNFFSFSKHDANWIIYSWANLSLDSNKTLMNVFKRTLNSSIWENNFNLFKKLYKLSYILSLTNSNNAISFYTKSLYSFSLKKEFLNFHDSLNFKYFSFFFQYAWNSTTNTFINEILTKKKLKTSKQSYEYNISSIETQSNDTCFLNSNKTGLFFLNSLSFEKFSYLSTNENSLFFFNLQLKNQVKSSKWNRWIYKYSILHRKIIKNSHKITISKKIVNSGFYNNNLFDKNLWASVNLLKYNSEEGVSNSLFNQLYPFFFNNNVSWANHELFIKKNSKSFEFIKYYESSFFWNIKRFFIFNNSSSNSIKTKKISKVRNKNLNSQHTKSNFNQYVRFLNLGQLSKVVDIKSFFNFNPIVFFFSRRSVIAENSPFYAMRDLNLSFEDLDILKKDNLDIFYWVSLQPFKKKNSYYNTYSFSSRCNFKISSLKTDTHSLNRYLINFDNSLSFKDFFLYLYLLDNKKKQSK